MNTFKCIPRLPETYSIHSYLLRYETCSFSVEMTKEEVKVCNKKNLNHLDLEASFCF